MENSAVYISISFVIITIVTLILFYISIKKSSLTSVKTKANYILIILIIWLITQAFFSLNDVYSSDLNSVPPKILILGIFPAALVIILILNLNDGKKFIDSLPIINITYINTIRIFVEIILYWLFLNKMIPKLMTFEGANLDILSGITAPFIAYYGFIRSKINNRVILIWNIVSLVLLINIVIIAFLSAPSPLQKIAFDQPNIAILYFPFSWLPTFIVPVIILGHIISIRRLLKGNIKKN